MAEGVGFEPTVTCATHALQACRFGRSRIPPGDGRRRVGLLTAVVRWPGPAQRDAVNRVRAGRQQLSAECPVCRSSAWPPRLPTDLRSGADAVPVALPALPAAAVRRGVGQDHVTIPLRNAVRDERGGARLPVQRASAARARRRRPASSPRRSTAPHWPTASRAARATRASQIAAGCVDRRVRARRRVEQRRRRHARPPREGRARHARAAQGVHRRRGPHAHGRGVERAAEDAGGAARPRRVRAGHHRPAEGAADDPQPHAALRVPPRRRQTRCAAHLEAVATDAKLDLPAEAVERAALRGAGSVRDALSALDQLAAAGGELGDEDPGPDRVVEGLCERDAAAVLLAVAESAARGGDARVIARSLVEHLRWLFLSLMAPDLVPVTGADRDRIDDQAKRLGAAAVVRSIEVLGAALVDMRDAVDPRVCLEAALVRLARPELDPSPEALLERLERLERRVTEGEAAAPPAAGGAAAPRRPRPGRHRKAPTAPKPGGAARRRHRKPPPASPSPPRPSRSPTCRAATRSRWPGATRCAIGCRRRRRPARAQDAGSASTAARQCSDSRTRSTATSARRCAHEIESALADAFRDACPRRAW